MKKKGFSLFEILISLIILSIAITGITVLYTSSKKFVLHGRSTFIGTELGKVFLDPLQMDVRQDTWLSNCLSSNPTAGCPSGSQVVNNIAYTPTYTINTVAGTSLRRVQLRLDWVEPNP